MKKAYMKPEIMFEDFSLSQNIAAGCEEKITNPSQDQCGIEFGQEVLFVASLGDVCTPDGQLMVEDVGGGDGVYNGICYHVFANDGERNLFNS